MSRPKPANSPHRKTCRRYNDPGHAHSLTFSCFQRQPFLTSERTCRWLVDAVMLAQSTHDFDLWAYVFMPEHVHLLVCPRRRAYDVSKFLTTIKLSVTRKAIAHVRENAPSFLERMLDLQSHGRQCHRFWQRGGGFDRNLWSEKALFAEIDYIHGNPVARGLCRAPEEWPWSSAADYLHVRRGPLTINLDSLPRILSTESARSQRPR